MTVKLNVYAVWAIDPNSGGVVPVGVSLIKEVADAMLEEIQGTLSDEPIAQNMGMAPAIMLFDESSFHG